MKRKQGQNFIKDTIGNNRGASLAIVMIIMVLFLTLGLGILAAASGASGSASRKETSQQTVYAASSAMEVMGKSLVSGELNRMILAEIVEKIATDSELEARVIRPEISLTGDALSAIRIKDVTIVYEKPDLEVKTIDPETDVITDYTLKLKDVIVQLTAEDQSKQTYTVKGHFSFSGGVELKDETWRWYGGWTKDYIDQPKN